MKYLETIEFLKDALPSDTNYDVWYDDMNGRWIIEVEQNVR